MQPGRSRWMQWRDWAAGGGLVSKPSRKPRIWLLTWHRGVKPSSLKGRAKLLCDVKSVSSREIHRTRHQEVSPQVLLGLGHRRNALRYIAGMSVWGGVRRGLHPEPSAQAPATRHLQHFQLFHGRLCSRKGFFRIITRPSVGSSSLTQCTPILQSGLTLCVGRTLVSYVTSLSLSFLICKMRVISGDCGEIKWDRECDLILFWYTHRRSFLALYFSSPFPPSVVLRVEAGWRGRGREAGKP